LTLKSELFNIWSVGSLQESIERGRIVIDVLSLQGKVALVTGAGQGVGRQAALHFAAKGARAVIVNDYFLERAEAVAHEVRELGAVGLAMQADVTSLPTVTEAVAAACSQVGELDILVNNAGNAGATGSLESLPAFWETGPDDWAKWLGPNLYGVLNVTRAVLPGMIGHRRGGSIVNVMSDAGRVGDGPLAVYSAAKAGAGGFSRALARAVGSMGIRVNNVSLAAINTPGVRALISDEAVVKKVLRGYVIPRLGEPADAANMILFLASDASSWITGQTFPVNGGFSFNQ
jgi:2-hydroxycyclohexanecarboxyl-CoA dehydrogenase